MKFKKSTVLPVILLVYLAGMSIIGIKGLRNGETSITTYVLTIIITLGLIIALHFFLKRQDRLKKERMSDIRNNEK